MVRNTNHKYSTNICVNGHSGGKVRVAVEKLDTEIPDESFAKISY